MTVGLLSVALLASPALTADDAVALALQHSARLTLLTHELDEARAEVQMADRLENPELRLGTFRSDRLVNPIFGEGDYRDPLDGVSVGVRWRPPMPGVSDYRRARAERRIEQVEARTRAARMQLAAEVREEHATVLNLAARVKLAATAVELRAALEALVVRQLEAQQATALERSTASLDHLDALMEHDELVARLEEARTRLFEHIGVGGDSARPLAAGDEAGCAPDPTPLATLVERALTDNPALVAHEARGAELGAEIGRTEWERMPWFDFLELEYGFAEGSNPVRMTNPVECQGQCDDPGYVGLSMSITLPILDRKSPELAALRAEKAAIESRKLIDRRRIEAQVRDVVADLERASTLYGRLVDSERLLEQTERRVRAGMNAGVVDPVQIAAAQRRMLSARRARLRIELRCAKARLALEQLTGGRPIPEESDR